MKHLKSIVVGMLVTCCVLASAAAADRDATGIAVTSDSASRSGVTARAQRKIDRKLSSDVRRALAKVGVDVSGVVVNARSGAVTLIGAVPENTQIARAESAAKTVTGVISVINKITVRPQM